MALQRSKDTLIRGGTWTRQREGNVREVSIFNEPGGKSSLLQSSPMTSNIAIRRFVKVALKRVRHYFLAPESNSSRIAKSLVQRNGLLHQRFNLRDRHFAGFGQDHRGHFVFPPGLQPLVDLAQSLATPETK